MKLRKILYPLLALILIVLCFACFRNDKQKSTDQVEEKQQEVTEQAEEKQQEEPTGIKESEEPLVIEVPEGMEIEEGGEDFGR